MVIDEDEEGQKKFMYRYDVLFEISISEKLILLLKVTQFNNPPVSNSTPSRLSPQG